MANNAEIIAAIEKMTILELADLVKEMEELALSPAARPLPPRKRRPSST